MALEEKEKITTKAIMEAEEEVKVTPPARRKKAERMKNKSSGNLSQLTCDNETNGTSAGDVTDGSSLTAAKVNENDVKISKPELSSQVDAMNSAELHDTKNGMPENSCAGETTDRNEGSFGNDLENSCVKATESVAFQNESKTTSNCKQNDEKAATVNVLSDIKEETEERLETCISSDITSGWSQDEESFFSAEEAETSASEVISSTLPNRTEVVKETSAELESQGDFSSVNRETRNTNEKAVANLEQDGQDLSKAQDSDLSGCLNESLQILTSKTIDETHKNSHISSKIGNKDLSSAEFSLIDSRTAKSSDTSRIVQIDSPSGELLGDELGAVGGAVETDSEEWSSSSATSSEGEYDVGYFEIFRGLQVSLIIIIIIHVHVSDRGVICLVHKIKHLRIG